MSPQQITRLKLAHGADAFGGLISSRCTNEELYRVSEVHAPRRSARTTSTAAPATAKSTACRRCDGFKVRIAGP